MHEIEYRIGQYLKAKGIKQVYVADNIQMNKARFTRVCQGKSALNCLEYYKICKVLNVPLEMFCEEEK